MSTQTHNQQQQQNNKIFTHKQIDKYITKRVYCWSSTAIKAQKRRVRCALRRMRRTASKKEQEQTKCDGGKNNEWWYRLIDIDILDNNNVLYIYTYRLCNWNFLLVLPSRRRRQSSKCELSNSIIICHIYQRAKRVNWSIVFSLFALST